MDPINLAIIAVALLVLFGPAAIGWWFFGWPGVLGGAAVTVALCWVAWHFVSNIRITG